jgi:hypothetical protein
MSRNARQTGHIACQSEMINAHTILVAELEYKRLLGGRGCRMGLKDGVLEYALEPSVSE